MISSKSTAAPTPHRTSRALVRSKSRRIAQMQVLVTGGAGFIGSHLVELLLRQGHAVHVIDDLSTGRVSNISPFMDNPQFRFDEADLVTWDGLDEVAQTADRIYHLAA